MSQGLVEHVTGTGWTGHKDKLNMCEGLVEHVAEASWTGHKDLVEYVAGTKVEHVRRV